ncbi:MAG: hypothetical protein ACLS54_05490 [Anaerostipes hadrus]
MKTAMEDLLHTEDKSTKSGGVFVKGLILALASGAGSAAINIGASASNYPVNLAVADGVNATSASLLSLGCCILWWIYCQF